MRRGSEGHSSNRSTLCTGEESGFNTVQLWPRQGMRVGTAALGDDGTGSAENQQGCTWAGSGLPVLRRRFPTAASSSGSSAGGSSAGVGAAQKLSRLRRFLLRTDTRRRMREPLSMPAAERP